MGGAIAKKTILQRFSENMADLIATNRASDNEPMTRSEIARLKTKTKVK
jgi:hypothetical protein